jgi:hypothetical protein
MSRFSSAQREAILTETRELLRRTAGIGGQQHEPEIIYKDRDNALVDHALSERSTSVASGSELPWQEWVKSYVDANNEGVGEALAKYCEQTIAPLRRELELLQQQFTVLREQVGLERGLAALREEVNVARAAVPKVPTIVEKLEAGQKRLEREAKTIKEKLTGVRVRLYESDYKLEQLQKSATARATEIETKIETIETFRTREIHPDAAATLRAFADEALKGHRGETIWLFDPNPRPRAGAA